MAEARKRGATVVTIVNVVGAQSTRSAEGLIYMHVGPEIGVAASKTFLGQVTSLFLLAVRMGQARGTMAVEDQRQALQALIELPGLVADVLARPTPYAAMAEGLHKKGDFLYLGRGIQFPIALEGALKLKEISYIHAEGYPAGEMKHGPIALIDEEMPVVAIAPRDRVYDKIVNNIEQVKARGGIVIAIAEDGDEAIGLNADQVIHVPSTWPHLMPVLTVLPLQLLAYHVAVRRGCDVDQPRNLAKSVTVE
jgi:glucosamine--fructose-6-phosphate aminotransferase (isomerizing)